MGDWPDNLRVGPIREWPGEFTAIRLPSRFRGPGGKSTPLSATLVGLDLELRELGALGAELLVAVDAAQFRRDGRPYANAKAAHPGVILSFDIPKVGHVSYPCDTFPTWEENLRAVVLALEALRKVDRYGVTKRGEQYRGFLAIEASAAPAGFSSIDEAIVFLARTGGFEVQPNTGRTRGAIIRDYLRSAQRRTHPDQGGEPTLFQRVSLAETRLREERVI